MEMRLIRNKELVVGKEYSLLNATMPMIISFANGGMLSEYHGLQIRFLVAVGTFSFYVGEGVQFLPTTGGSIFKIVARKTGIDDKRIKPIWQYYLLEYENKN